MPDLVLISAGFDSMAGDPLGAFTLEYEHFEQLTRFLVERAESVVRRASGERARGWLRAGASRRRLRAAHGGVGVMLSS